MSGRRAVQYKETMEFEQSSQNFFFSFNGFNKTKIIHATFKATLNLRYWPDFFLGMKWALNNPVCP